MGVTRLPTSLLLLLLLAKVGAEQLGELVEGEDVEEVEDVGEVEGSREGKQYGSGRPGISRVQLTRLQQGPLTLQGGHLRPVGGPGGPRAGGGRVGGPRVQGVGNRRSGVLPLLPQSPRPALPTLRPNYFNSDNVRPNHVIPYDPIHSYLI